MGRGEKLTAAGKHKKIPCMAGSTSEDLMPPILQKMAKDLCAVQEKPSYTWFFDSKLPVWIASGKNQPRVLCLGE